MAIVGTSYGHIVLDKKNQAIIEGANCKVIELILDKIAYGWSPEELQYQHPQLTLGQVYSALAYYADHQEELDKEMEIQLEQIDQLTKSAGPSPLIKRLKAKKLI